MPRSYPSIRSSWRISVRRDLRVVYFIDARDKIIFVNENWDEHARENNAHHLTGQNILGCDLWQFISHETLRQVYREFIRRARVSEAVRVEFNGLSSAHRYPTVVRVEGGPKIVRFEIEVAEKRLRFQRRNMDRGRRGDRTSQGFRDGAHSRPFTRNLPGLL